MTPVWAVASLTLVVGGARCEVIAAATQYVCMVMSECVWRLRSAAAAAAAVAARGSVITAITLITTPVFQLRVIPKP